MVMSMQVDMVMAMIAGTKSSSGDTRRKIQGAIDDQSDKRHAEKGSSQSLPMVGSMQVDMVAWSSSDDHPMYMYLLPYQRFRYPSRARPI